MLDHRQCGVGAGERLELRLLAPAAFVAVGAVLVSLAVQLARFIGEALDLDAMVAVRESSVFHRAGLAALIGEHAGRRASAVARVAPR